MPDVIDTMTINESNVRKWGTKILAVQDYSAAVPTDLFDEAYLPVLAAGAKQLGFVTTDGVVQAKSISTENTQMDQSLVPVRTDLTGIEHSLTVTFGESSSAWVNAVAHGQLVSAFAGDPDSAWDFDDDGVDDYPYYRLWLIAQDGVGDQARYRVEYMYKAKVTAMTDRTLSRTTAEGFGFTFGLFRDPVAGKVLRRAEDAPALHAPASLPLITAVTPSGGSVGDVLRIEGARFTGATAVSIDATSADFQVASGSLIFASIPSGAAGAADITVTTPAGTSTAFSYTVV